MKKFLTRKSPSAHLYDKEEVWKFDVGVECNRLLELADKLEANQIGFHNTPMISIQNEYTDAIRSIVRRVAHFEFLEYEPEVVECPRCDGSGEEPGAPVDLENGVALCVLCKGSCKTTPHAAEQYKQGQQ